MGGVVLSLRRALAGPLVGLLLLPACFTPHTAAKQEVADPAAKVCHDLRTYGYWSTLALGDSIVAGAGASRPERGWIQLLSWKAEPGQTWNMGLNGSTTAQHIPGGTEHWRVQVAQWAQPSLILMDWRVNDEWAQYRLGDSPPATVAAQYQAVIASLRSYSPDSSILVVNPPYFSDTWLDDQLRSQGATARDYAAAIKQVAEDEDVLYLDLPWYFPSSVGETDYIGWYADSTHPADAGHAVARTALEASIRARCA